VTVGAVQFGVHNGRPPEGAFLFSDVPPGDYYLVASLSSTEDPHNGQAPRGRIFENGTLNTLTWEKESAYVLVTVREGADLTVSIRTNAGASISGRVVVEGGDVPVAGAAPDAESVSVSATPTRTGTGQFLTSSRAPIGAGAGTFTLTGVRGAVTITARGDRMALKSVMRADADLTGKAIEFNGTERVNDLVVTMTRDTASVQGTVSMAAPGGAMAILFPEDSARWGAGTALVRVARVLTGVAAGSAGVASGSAAAAPTPPASGRFALKTVLPGRYLMAAVADTGPVAAIDAVSLEKLRPVATGVTLVAGDTATVTLKVADK
jgi:hypothetical protein